MNLIEQLLQHQSQATLLQQKVSDGGQQIEVHQFEDLRWLYTGGQSIQSIICLSKPAEFMYFIPQVMLVSLLLLESPTRVLNLGYGGGAFERFFAAKNTQMNMISVDSSEAVVELTKKYLQTPSLWPVVIDSAQHYLQHTTMSFDLILCDLFVGEKQASCLSTASFYQDAANCLGDNGVMAINMCPQSDSELVQLLTKARQYFKGAMISKAGQLENLILILSRQPLVLANQLQASAHSGTQYWQLDFATLLAGFSRFPN